MSEGSAIGERDDEAIHVCGVSCAYRRDGQELWALRDVDLDITRGERIAVVGPSGCGKTTLLRILAGLLPPTVGEVIVFGEDPEAYRERNGVGFVFQESLLFPWRTVLGNVMLPADITGRSESASGKARDLLGAVGLGDVGNARPGQLSGGMRQRAALVRALLLDPGLLLLDEPFSALDEITREQLWVDVPRLWDTSRASVVLVTHSVREAVFLSDRVIVISSSPGAILGEFAINLDRRRGQNQNLLSSSGFLAQCREIRQAMDL